MSAFLFQQGRNYSYDFIISMIPLSNTEKPVVDVSHLTKNQRVQMIEEFLFEKLDNKGDV